MPLLPHLVFFLTLVILDQPAKNHEFGSFQKIQRNVFFIFLPFLDAPIRVGTSFFLFASSLIFSLCLPGFGICLPIDFHKRVFPPLLWNRFSARELLHALSPFCCAHYNPSRRNFNGRSSEGSLRIFFTTPVHLTVPCKEEF